MSEVLWLALAALGVAAIAALGWLAWRLRRRRFQRRVTKVAPRLRHAVVLAHGIMGFDEMKLGPLKGAYFRGVEPRLTQLGAKVFAFRVRPAASVAQRAEDLKRAVEALDVKQVNVVAHSMGGLDARYAVARLGLRNKVASITTIGTPHRGTPLADMGTGLWGLAPAARRLLESMGVDVDGFFDLTTARMLAFNAEIRDVPGIWYASWIARASGGVLDMNPLLLPTWKLIRDRAGENDGLVPADSQRWGEVCGTVEADHWAQIGWSRTFDAPEFYEAVVKELMYRGL